MTIQLVVVRPFRTFAKGDLISESALVAEILASEQAVCVVRVEQAAASGQQGV